MKFLLFALLCFLSQKSRAGIVITHEDGSRLYCQGEKDKIYSIDTKTGERRVDLF